MLPTFSTKRKYRVIFGLNSGFCFLTIIGTMEGQSGQKEHFLILINDLLILENHLLILINDLIIFINIY